MHNDECLFPLQIFQYAKYVAFEERVNFLDTISAKSSNWSWWLLNNKTAKFCWMTAFQLSSLSTSVTLFQRSDHFTAPLFPPPPSPPVFPLSFCRSVIFCSLLISHPFFLLGFILQEGFERRSVVLDSNDLSKKKEKKKTFILTKIVYSYLINLI